MSFSSFLHTHSAPQRTTLFPYTTLFRSVAEATKFAAYTNSLPIWWWRESLALDSCPYRSNCCPHPVFELRSEENWLRSEEHTSELQSLTNLVCRLLLEKKKDKDKQSNIM